MRKKERGEELAESYGTLCRASQLIQYLGGDEAKHLPGVRVQSEKRKWGGGWGGYGDKTAVASNGENTQGIRSIGGQTNHGRGNSFSNKMAQLLNSMKATLFRPGAWEREKEGETVVRTKKNPCT